MNIVRHLALARILTDLARTLLISFISVGLVWKGWSADSKTEVVNPKVPVVVTSKETETSSEERSRSNSSTVTFFEPNATSVKIDGREYDLGQAIEGLNKVLESGDAEAKRKWFGAVAAFRTDLSSNLVSRLMLEFRKERNPTVRRAILNAIELSRDSRFIEFCMSCGRDSDPLIRLRAGTTLIEGQQVRGLEVLTSCLPELNERGQFAAMVKIMAAKERFGLDFKDEGGDTESEAVIQLRLRVLMPRWTKWWNANRAKFGFVEK